jgi:hypothetical protein
MPALTIQHKHHIMNLFRNETVKKLTCSFLALATFCSTNTSWASPAQSESIARRMAIRLAAEGYAVTPVAMDVLGAGQTANHYLRVEPGVDYAITVGGDTDALNIDLIIYDEFGQEMIRDTRLSSLAGATFRSTYAGQVKVIVIMRQARTLGAYCLMQSSRTGLRLNFPAPGTPGTTN